MIEFSLKAVARGEENDKGGREGERDRNIEREEGGRERGEMNDGRKRGAAVRAAVMRCPLHCGGIYQNSQRHDDKTYALSLPPLPLEIKRRARGEQRMKTVEKRKLNRRQKNREKGSKCASST